jgi:CubicO group peptidase (beta-lactamase class C family)
MTGDRPVRALWPVRAAAITLCLVLSSCGGPGAPEDESPDAVRTTRGLDPQGLAETVAAARELPRLNSLIVLRHGETLAEHRFNDGSPLDRPVNIKSASKSVLSALVGIAIARGVLEGTQQPVLTELARFAPSDPDPRLERLTVGHLLSMQAGLQRTSGPNYGSWVSSSNWVRYALSQPFVDDPGGRMLYSTGSSHLLSAMLTEASGRSTYELAQEWLAGPLDISIPEWPRDPQGYYFGGNDMLMSPRGLARFGELYRNGGRVGDVQVLPAVWIEESWTPRARSPWSGNDYGYGWFLAEVRGHPVRFAWGYGGQMLYIVPSLSLTVVMTSDADAERDIDHIQALHALLANGIIPAAERGASEVG